MNYCLPVSMSTSPVNDLASLLGAPPRKDLVVMRTYDLTHLSDAVLLRDLKSVVAQERGATATVLAHIAEVDVRRLYVPAGFPSMFLYCVHELHFSEDAARKRIHAARAARRFPAIFSAVADSRLHLSAVVTLAPHLTEDTADELLTAATHKTRAEIELLLAQRCPRPDVPARLEAISSPSSPTLSIRPADPKPVGILTEQRAPGRVEAPPMVAPLSPQRYALQLTIAQSTHDKLRYAKELLSHQVPSGDLAEVLERTLDIAIGQLEKRKFAATRRPRRRRRGPTANHRYIPAEVKRGVWQRDGGQ